MTDTLGSRGVTGPVVVGGSGGSGTRLVAQLLIDLDFDLGPDLNRALDNQWFTLLLKRPRWLGRASPDDVRRGLAIFERVMRGRFPLTSADVAFVLRAVGESLFGRHDAIGSGRRLWSLGRLRTMLRHRPPDPLEPRRWGWKEPNTQFFLEPLAEHFDGLRYVHVLRNGLDMAFSDNQAQLVNWGERFDLPPPKSRDAVPTAALEFWIRSNRAAIQTADRLLGERLFVLNFDALCRAPQPVIEALVTFLDIDLRSVDMAELAGRVEPPLSRGRYRQYDLDVFDAAQIEAVRELGFDNDLTTES